MNEWMNEWMNIPADQVTVTSGALHVLQLQLSPSPPPSSLASTNPVMETFWYRLLTRVWPGKAPLNNCCFYRVTLCVSAVFALARCPSVRLSVTLVDCIPTAEDIIIPLLRPGSPITLVFLTPCVDIQFQGKPLQRGEKYTGWEKLAIFDRNRRILWKRSEIGQGLLWNVNRKS